MALYNHPVTHKSKQIIAVCVILMVPGIVILTGSNHQDSKKEAIKFQTDIVPLLKSNCQPCHYPGGKMYKKLPFDDYLTVKKIGKKLNSRFNEQSQKDMVTEWVDSGARVN